MRQWQEGRDYQLMAYEPSRHAAFVFSSWAGRAPVGGPGSERRPLRNEGDLADYLRRPETRCWVAVHPVDPGVIFGWACATAGAVVWVYVRDLYGKEIRQQLAGLRQRQHEGDDVGSLIERLEERLVRRRGLGTSLLIACGIDPSQPTPCRYWSEYGASWAARPGVRLYYDPTPEDERKIA